MTAEERAEELHRRAGVINDVSVEDFAAVIQEAILQEREACAQIADGFAAGDSWMVSTIFRVHRNCAEDVAKLIRNRGQLENFLNSPGPRSRRFSSDAAVSDAERSRGTGMTL